MPTSIDTASGNTSLRTTSYGTASANTTANALNQYTRIARPAFFNVRGTRASGATIRVNGDLVDTTNSSDSGYQPNQNGTYFRDEVPNTTPSGTTSPDLFEPVKVTSNNNPFTVEDPVQYVAPPQENLTYDADGNLLTDGRWTLTPPPDRRLRAAATPAGCLSPSSPGGRLTCDAADRLIRMESQPFQQPAYGAAPLDLPQMEVKGLKVEFAYDAFSRRIRKKVSRKNLAPGSQWELKTHEAYVYDGWNMIASYALETSGPNAGKGKERIASHVWGPDIGSNPAAGRDWQAAGGVGGLNMTLNPPPPSNPNPMSYEDWLGAQCVYPASGGYGYETYYGWLHESELEDNGWGYSQYATQVLTRHHVQVPVMDHMGNVISVIKFPGNENGASAQTEFVYDYDAFGKEIRSSALIAGNSPDSYPFHYSTKFTDAETGLVYYGYRFYDPVNGRWINRDPSGENGGFNLNGLEYNNFITGIDLLGAKILIMGHKDYHQVHRDREPNTVSGDAKFAETVRKALESGVSKDGAECLKLKLIEKKRGPLTIFWEVKAEKGKDFDNPICRCKNVERLIKLINNERAAKIFHTKGGAHHHPIPVGNDSNVHVDPSKIVPLPTQNADGSLGPVEPADFGTILWHETVGHAGRMLEGLDSSHPKEPWNRGTDKSDKSDPVIDIENEYRDFNGIPKRFGKYFP